jgi:uncharacterized membrane protein YfcA
MLPGMVRVLVGAVVLLLSLTGVAVAQEAKPKKTSAAEGQENFGFGAGIGFVSPSGLVLRAGARVVSVEGAAGFMPALLSYGSQQNPQLKLIAPLEATGQVVFEVLEFPREIRGGLRLGYRHNLVLGPGGTLGGQIGKRWGHLLLEGVWGISLYPDARDRLNGEQVPEGTSYNFPPELNWGLSVQVLYYP